MTATLTPADLAAGAGTTVMQAFADDAAPGSEAQPRPTKTILVVDDELGPREALRFILTPFYNVTVAKDGREALERFVAERPDMVISDIRMPVMTGIELMKALRWRSPETPFVLLTGYATLASAQEAVRQGAFDYISKPYNVKDIRQLVARALEEAEAKAEARLQLARLQSVNAMLEEQVRELDQKAALGELSAEMIHDLNNPMSILGGYVSLLEDSMGQQETTASPAESREFITIIKEQIERCIALTRRFLDYARDSRQAWCQESINDVMQDTLFVLRTRMDALQVKLESNLEEGLPQAWIQPTPLQQVFHNMVANALDALSEVSGARALRVSSRLRSAGSDVGEGEGAIEVVIEDTGPGVAPEMQEQIFTPFFSTKPKGKGTGIGLSICRRVVEEHRGTIRLESTPGRGARFTISIPLRRQKPGSPDAP